MTNKEIIDELSKMPPMVLATAYLYACELDRAYHKGYNDALDCKENVWEIAYKRGKVEVLNKLTAEIERHRRKTESIDTYDLVGDCLDFINKYKGEQNET